MPLFTKLPPGRRFYSRWVLSSQGPNTRSCVGMRRFIQLHTALLRYALYNFCLLFRGSSTNYICSAFAKVDRISPSCACSSSDSSMDELRSVSYLRTRLPLGLIRVVVALPCPAPAFAATVTGIVTGAAKNTRSFNKNKKLPSDS